MLQESHRTMLRSYGIVLARVLLGALFFLSGLQTLLSGSVGLAGVAGMISSTGIPLAMLAAYIVIAIKILGGSALILGYRTGMAAGALFLFTGAATLAFHMAPVESMGLFGWDMGLFKNLSIMGGLLYAMTYGPGNGWKVGQ
ncbi:DoxX family protein [Patescibacteria group bacterium]|nr:DoxX family protein [Patescibacteria group bacterium]